MPSSQTMRLSDVSEKCTQLSLTILDILKPWIECNSYSGNIEGVNAMGDLLVRDFSMDGLFATRQPGKQVGDHLIFRTPGWESAAASDRLLLVGHHDTVFPPGTFDVFELAGDTLRGPGVLDMKGGLATVYLALKSFSSLGALSSIPLAFICVGDEEIGSPDSSELLLELARGIGGALVFEAGRAQDAVITRRKGTGALRVSVRGRAAHAGNHHKEGVNAICALAKLISGVERFTDYDKGVTVNVGIIEGGSARNTVPEHAECQIDFRLIHTEDGEELVQRVKALALEIAKATNTEITVEGGVRRGPLTRTDASAELYTRYAAAAKATGLGHSEAGLIGGGSDASAVSAVGTPAIDGLGPRGKGFHTHDEYIEVSSLALRAEALVRFIVAW
ncbi:MAG: M20 family metallopeptidase [Kofleriaceae bacterium]|nr:M20 family metallopeptidase [Kofleriaceae bacterium]